MGDTSDPKGSLQPLQSQREQRQQMPRVRGMPKLPSKLPFQVPQALQRPVELSPATGRSAKSAPPSKLGWILGGGAALVAAVVITIVITSGSPDSASPSALPGSGAAPVATQTDRQAQSGSNYGLARGIEEQYRLSLFETDTAFPLSLSVAEYSRGAGAFPAKTGNDIGDATGAFSAFLREFPDEPERQRRIDMEKLPAWATNYTDPTGVAVEQAVKLMLLFRGYGIPAKFAKVTVDFEGNEVEHGCVAVTGPDGSPMLFDPGYHAGPIPHRQTSIMSDTDLVKLLTEPVKAQAQPRGKPKGKK